MPLPPRCDPSTRTDPPATPHLGAAGPSGTPRQGRAAPALCWKGSSALA